MKLTFLLITITLCFTPHNAYNQEKKYQSLLWEISGNGLTKKSYMYGTMHVSEKISYHLSDSFFEHILNVDIVATESDPATWDNIANIYYSPMDLASRKFYRSFYIFPIVKDDLSPLFYGMNYNQSHLMSRTDERKRNYQEDTYLDMFIYRTGRKYGKICVGLEDAKESLISIEQGRINARSVDHTFDEQALSRLQKSRNAQDLLEEYYREKDLDMLDSLVRLTSHPSVLEGLLFNRNRVMVDNMDSIMKTGSLFAAVGASHLPGKNGMIEMLRSLGYTVEPVFSDYTDTGRKTKKTIESFFLKPTLNLYKSNDGMIEIPLFDHYSENKERIESADIVNGGYINVKRILLNDFLRKDDTKFNHLTLDSLFFENIPGDILEKKFYQENGVLIYDIKSATKTKKAEHYRYYITPLEIIAVIMGGEGDYVRQFEDQVFGQIKIKTDSNEAITFSPKRGGFEITLPNYSKILGDHDSTQRYSDVELYSYDKNTDSYYFLIERTSTEANELYESKFELERIAFEFLFQFDAEPTDGQFNEEKLEYRTQSKIGNKKIHLLTTMKGAKYYLLATINTDENEATSYFSTFQFTELVAETEYVKFEDRIAGFSIEIPKKYNEFLDLQLTGKEREWSDKNKFNVFDGQGDRYTFYNPTGEFVSVSYYVYSEYDGIENRDLMWEEYIENLTSTGESEDDSLELDQNYFTKKRNELNFDISRWTLDMKEQRKDEGKYKFIDQKLTEPDENGVQILTGMIVTNESTQATRIKVIISEGAYYYIQALVEKSNPETSKFINNCFSTFEINPRLNDNSIFVDKLDRFLLDVYSEVDSISYSALQSASSLNINQKNAEKFEGFMKTYEFQPEDLFIELALAAKLLDVNEHAGIDYFEKLYKSDRVLPSTQLEILSNLAEIDDRNVYNKIQELMEYDLPLAEYGRDINQLFYIFQEQKSSSALFPNILQFYGVPEYNNALIDFTEYAVNNDFITSKKLKPYRKVLLTNAKLEYKRLAAWKQEEDLKELDVYGSDYFYGYQSRAPIDKLLKYLHILEAFKNDKDLAELKLKVDKLNLNEFYLDQIASQIKNNKSLDRTLVDKLMTNSETQFSMYQAMHHQTSQDDLESFQDAQIAMAGVQELNKFETDKDSLTFLESIDYTYRNLNLRYFFFKVTNIDEDAEEIEAEKIAGIAFVVEGNGINPQSYFKFRPQQYIEEAEIAEFIKESIDKSIYQNVERASHAKFDPNNYEDYFDEYYNDAYYEEEYYEEEYYEEGY